MAPGITFVVAVNNRQILADNFLASPCLQPHHPHQVILQESFRSAATAYNDAIERSVNDLMVFLHQDVVLPKGWLSDLWRALECLQGMDPNWGVLGCYGETADDNGRGRIYAPGQGFLGKPLERPAAVQTLDEIVLILRRSSGLRFDERLPHFHLYGPGICLAAAARGKKSYAISALCVHNTQQIFVLPPEFYECYAQFRRIWKDELPIRTTCVTVTRSNFPVFVRRLQEIYMRYIAHKTVGARRATNIPQVLKGLEAD